MAISVLISVTTDMSPTGDLLVTSIFAGGVCFVVFLFPVLQVFGIPNSPRSLDLDDRQGFIASSAMQQKKKMMHWLTILST